LIARRVKFALAAWFALIGAIAPAGALPPGRQAILFGGPSYVAPSIPGLVNYNRAYLSHWHAARKAVNAGARNARVLFLGDSTTSGAHGSASNANAFAGGFPSQAAALVPHGSNQSWFGNNCEVNVALPTFDYRISLGSWDSTTFPTVFGVGGYSLLTDTATGGNFTFTPTANVDTFQVFWANNSGLGSFAFAIDSGTQTTFNENGAISIATQTFTTTLGSHVGNIIYNSTGYYADVLGIIATNSAKKEVSFINGGSCSALAADFGDNAANGPWEPTLFAPNNLAPDITFIDLTINDWNAATNTTNYTASLQRIITAAKATGDCVLMTGNPSEFSVGSDANQTTQRLYSNIVLSLAQSNNCVAIDVQAAFGGGSWTGANALGLTADNLHPSVAGYAVIAGWVAALLNAK
jgi:lysophospholipase L1-like esterase